MRFKKYNIRISRSERLVIYGDLLVAISALSPLAPLGKISKFYWGIRKYTLWKLLCFLRPRANFELSSFYEYFKMYDLPIGMARSVIEYANLSKKFYIIITDTPILTGYILQHHAGGFAMCNNINFFDNCFDHNLSPIAPRPISINHFNGDSYSVSEYIIGRRRVFSSLNYNHFFLLLTLHKSGLHKKLLLCDYLSGAFDKIRLLNIKYDEKLLLFTLRWKRQFGQLEIPTGITHGDFAPYNMIFTKDDKIFLIDWETSADSGFLLFDLIYYHISVNSLFKHSSTTKLYLRIISDSSYFMKLLGLRVDLVPVLVICDLINIFHERKSKYPNDPLTKQTLVLIKYILESEI